MTPIVNSPLQEDLKQTARALFAQVLAESNIDRAFDRNVSFVDEPENPHILLSDTTSISLAAIHRICIVAAGKAAAPMLTSLLCRLPPCELQGVLIAPTQPPNLPATIQFFAGGHPVPNAASSAGASAALMLVSAAAASPADTLCIFLISGGASSMMELPLDPAITHEETVTFHQALVHSGATIVEMNALRKHFSAVKGGRLALAASPAPTLTLLVSDVPASHLDALGSGPTLPDTTTVSDCRTILETYNLLPTLPASIRRFFCDRALPETPKPGQIHSPFCTLLDSDHLAELTRARATTLGFHAVIDNTCDDWPFDRAADHLLNRIRSLRLAHGRVCLISAGEVAVRLPSLPCTSIGGRNQHFALYAATRFTPSDSDLAVLSAGTDGIDGNSAAAGAVVDCETVEQSARSSALAALATFNSGTWLTDARSTLVTGPTGQNLRDLRILLAE